MPRTKVLIIDGVDLKIASLSLDQVDELFVATKESGNTSVGKRAVIIQSLNRATPAEPWDEKRYQAEFDLVLVEQVFSEVIAFSGLKVGGESPGGAQAASAISSAKSDAA